MANPSFFFAIFKKLQVCDPAIAGMVTSPGGANHFSSNRDDMNAGGLAGGFALFHPGDFNGIFGSINSMEADPADLANQTPLAPNNLFPEGNPIYQMLHTCTCTNPGATVTVGAYTWPTMPAMCNVANNAAWQEFGPAAVAALGTWISAGKLNDEPQGPLYYQTLNPGIYASGGLPTSAGPQFVPKPPPNTPYLFVCSMPGDNGVRPGNVPNNFWATSQIYLMQTDGVVLTQPIELLAGNTYYLVAAIGNSGTTSAGRLPAPIDVAPLAIWLVGWAMVFGTLYAPVTQLPPLSNLPSETAMVYEQYFMPNRMYDVVGFGFDVSAVFGGLVDALDATHADLGGATPEQWLNATQPSIRVYIAQGGQYPAGGGITAPRITSSPQENCGIAWKNVGYFVMKVGHGISWTNIIVSQATVDPEGVNFLRIEHDLPPDSFRFLLAMPTKPFERYVRKAGGIDGFEIVRDVASKPFPDAVILRETKPGSLLEIAGHAREPFLGMSLGIDYDATRIEPGPIGSVSVIHLAGEREVVGGCTIEVEKAGAR